MLSHGPCQCGKTTLAQIACAPHSSHTNWPTDRALREKAFARSVGKGLGRLMLV